MAIDLKKHIVDLRKKAAFMVNKHGLEGQCAQVVLVLDISKSMNRLYKDGTVQRVIERMLALALNFDDDGQIDLMLFGTRAYQLPAVTLDDIEGAVERVILTDYRIIEATRYAPPLQMIHDKYKAGVGDPVFVIFLTDGGNSDRKESTENIRKM